MPIEKICKTCKTKFKVTPNRIKAKYCSFECRNKMYSISGNFKGRNNPQWKGGTYKHSKGYIYILKPDHPLSNHQGYILEHRFVMGNHIGRYLESTEFIHHINGNPSDNRIENLKLCKSNSEHKKLHIRKWPIKKCILCNKKFIVKTTRDIIRSKFCSEFCRQKAFTHHIRI